MVNDASIRAKLCCAERSTSIQPQPGICRQIEALSDERLTARLATHPQGPLQGRYNLCFNHGFK